MEKGSEFSNRGKPHALSGGIGGDQLRVLVFECDQLAKELVVLLVGYLRLVERIVAVIVVADLFPEFFYSFVYVFSGFVFAHGCPGLKDG